MKRTAGTIFCFVAIMLFISGCGRSEEEKRAAELDRLQRNADYIVSNLRYIKDPRTDLCFTYTISTGTKSLTEVPCEKIPPNMLVFASPD